MILTPADCQIVEAAIEKAEKTFSGEIRVHVDHTCLPDVRDSAAKVFARLGMHKTALRNGVLFYIAEADRKFAVLGDAGINCHVTQQFWDEVLATMSDYFIRGEFASGLCRGIHLCAEKLRLYFPPTDESSANNELPNEVSFGENANQ